MTELGIQFVPLIVEAHSGTWGPIAQKFWKKLAKHANLTLEDDDRQTRFRMMQQLAVILQRENARAILRRFCPAEDITIALPLLSADAVPSSSSPRAAPPPPPASSLPLAATAPLPPLSS